MGTIVWVRPSGSEITTNDRKETIEAAAKQGWKNKADVKTADRRPTRSKKDD